MSNQLRCVIAAGVGLVAGVLLMLVGSGALSAQNASAQAVGAGTVPAGYQMVAVPAAYASAAPAPTTVRTVSTRAAAPRRTTAKPAASKRSWQKTALVIGGSAGAGAGIGAIAGDKKGALIGAAIGGGAAAIYEAIKRSR